MKEASLVTFTATPSRHAVVYFGNSDLFPRLVVHHAPFEDLDSAWEYALEMASRRWPLFPVLIDSGGEALWKAPVDQSVPGGVFLRSEIVASLKRFGQEYGLGPEVSPALPKAPKGWSARWPVRMARKAWARTRQVFLDWSSIGWFL